MNLVKSETGNFMFYRLLTGSALLIGLSFGVMACNGSGGGSSPSGKQFDRMGIAGVNTVFLPSGQKDDFNDGDPSLDDSDYADEVLATTQGLRAALAGIPGFPPEDLGIAPESVVTIIIPDVVTIDLSTPDGFPNGRRLEDDVIDTALQVTLNRSVVGDGVGNDSTFLPTFPYLGPPK